MQLNLLAAATIFAALQVTIYDDDIENSFFLDRLSTRPYNPNPYF